MSLSDGLGQRMDEELILVIHHTPQPRRQGVGIYRCDVDFRKDLQGVQKPTITIEFSVSES